MFSLIEEHKIYEIYSTYFAEAKIKQKNKYTSKNLVSFFSKFIHTFLPDEYCALDNPIKRYFKLDKESFFISYIIVNKAYADWINDNEKRVYEIKVYIRENDPDHNIKIDKITSMKILDLIFWDIANEKIKVD